MEWHYEMEKNEDELLVRPTCAPSYYRVVLEKAKEQGDDFKRRTLQFSTGGSKGCLAGQLIVLIDVDGNVLPCSYFPMAAGNIREQSFKEIWEESKLFKDLRDFKPKGQVRLLRVRRGLRRLPGPGLRHDRRLHGRGALLQPCAVQVCRRSECLRTSSPIQS